MPALTSSTMASANSATMKTLCSRLEPVTEGRPRATPGRAAATAPAVTGASPNRNPQASEIPRANASTLQSS